MALAVSLSIIVIQLSHTVHPPGAAAVLTAVVRGENVHQLGWLCPLFPIGASCIIMLSVRYTILTTSPTTTAIPAIGKIAR
ncbi:HPP family protein [Halomonas sp. ISL-56]|uniref:HPP family protein n=1 Tax=Halomonas sp. ISL-56 TaxID=2819149 RepID=UPI002035C5E2|nr:HPP family protein [Halomonas sp. ISL-56]